MKFVRSKAIIFAILIMSVFCFAAIYISVGITGSMINERKRAEEIKPVAEQSRLQNVNKLINVNKIKEMDFIYNGTKMGENYAFVTDKKQILVPIDVILKELGIDFKYYSSDDIMEADINQKKLTIHIGKDKFTYGGQDMYFTTLPIVLKNHIFVPTELFSYIKWLALYGYIDENAVFMNNFPGYKPGMDSNIKALRLSTGSVSLTDITGKKLFWTKKGNSMFNGTVESSLNKLICVLKEDNKVYMVKNNKKVSPYEINVNPMSRLTLDGKYLYWRDKSKNLIYLYNTADGSVSNIKDFYFYNEIDSRNPNITEDFNIINKYVEKGKYKSILMTDVSNGTDYAYIEKAGKVILKSNVVLSPDGNKLLYYKYSDSQSSGYYIINIDGTNQLYIGNCDRAEWVTDTKIMTYVNEWMYIYNVVDETSKEVAGKWNYVGKSLDGAVFFSKGNILYSEQAGKESLIFELPWKCDYISSQSAKGPYIICSGGKQDSVFLIGNNMSIKIGKDSLLLKSYKFGKENTDYINSISNLFNNKYITVFQEEKGFIALNIIKSDGSEKKKIILNCSGKSDIDSDMLKLIRISDKRLVVYDSTKYWVIDFEKDTKVYEGYEPVGGVIWEMMN
jgi:hypothetical protein